MTSRWIPAAVLGAAALVCVLLGNWQIRRLEEKRAWIEQMQGRLELPPAPLERALDTPDAFAFRRVRARGEWLTGETILVRHRGAAPGPRVITPLRLGEDRALVLVDRGFMPPDIAEAFVRAEEPDQRADVDGVLLRLTELPMAGPAGERRLLWNRLHPAAMERQFGEAIERVLVVRLPGGSRAYPRGDTPHPSSRVNHLYYAITWYSCALVAVGSAAGLSRRRVQI